MTTDCNEENRYGTDVEQCAQVHCAYIWRSSYKCSNLMCISINKIVRWNKKKMNIYYTVNTHNFTV